MYGTLYNYNNGYGLDNNNHDGACGPRHLLDTYNNRYVTNPRNKISKLDMAKLLEILGMQNLHEGCPIEQIANLCDRYNQRFYTTSRESCVFTELGSVQLLFYSEIEKGNIHNSRIKTSKGNIVAFEMGDSYIEENPNIESVLNIIGKLNHDSTKYKYMGQSLNTLAYEYFTKRFDRNIASYCNPQVYHIINIISTIHF